MAPLSLSNNVPAIDVYLRWTPGLAIGVVFGCASVVSPPQVLEGELAHLRWVRTPFRPDGKATLLGRNYPDCQEKD